MKLYWSPTSPFTRKVRAVILEKRLTPLVEPIKVDVWGEFGTLHRDNPFGKVPCLVLDDGLALYDSPVICAYLDAHPSGEGPPLYPAAGRERWLVMKAEALADGMMELAVNMVVEARKPADQRSAFMVARWTAALGRAFDAAMPCIRALPPGFTQVHLAMACALGYMDFRFPEMDWRGGRPDLARWFEAQSPRPCLAETVPQSWPEKTLLA